MISLVLAVALAAAEPAPAPAQLKWDPRIDLPVVGVTLVAWLSSDTFLKHSLAPPSCRWCVTNGFDTSIRSVFNPSQTPSASGFAGPDAASNVGLILTPLAMVGVDLLLTLRDGVFGDFPIDVTIIAEATLAALCVTQLVKFSVGRARPYSINAPDGLVTGDDNNLSFFSGHTSLTFAVVSAAGTVATLRGYRLGWLTWAIGYPLAFATSALRLAADKHWASDVLMGMAVGALFGVGIPLLFHGKASPGPQLQVTAAPGGIGVGGTF